MNVLACFGYIVFCNTEYRSILFGSKERKDGGKFSLKLCSL